MLGREAMVALVGAALLYPLALGMDARRPERPDVLATLPPDALLPILAFGQRETAADILEIRTVAFLSESLDKFLTMEHDHLWALYDAIMVLDSQNVGACFRGSMFISAVANRPDSAIHMLTLTLGTEDPEFPYGEVHSARSQVRSEHPQTWLLYHEYASVYFLLLRPRTDDPERKQELSRRAGELWMLAGSQPGGPESLLSVGRKLVSEGWTPLQGFEQERVLWEQRSTSGDVLQRAKAKERLAEATCGRNREALQQVYTAMVSRGTTAKNVSELPIRAEYLEDPLGVGFLIVNGRVVAPGYEAANAERDVRVLFRGWQRAHPGETPTEADFPEIKARLRPYLRLVVTPDRLKVEGFLPE